MTIINNSKKCLSHPNNDVLFIQCNNVQICTKCVTSKDFHSGHQIIKIGESSSSNLIEESNKKFDEKKKEFENELKTFNKELENVKRLKLKAIHQENLKIHSSYISKLESGSSSGIETPQYKDDLITIDEDLIDAMPRFFEKMIFVSEFTKETGNSGTYGNSSSKSSQEATTAKAQSSQKQPQQQQKQQQNVSEKIYPKDDRQSTLCHFANKEFLIYRNGDIIPNGVENIAIAYGHSIPAVIPSLVDGILLPDGYSEPFPTFPSTCKNQQITKDTIPSNVLYLIFEDIVHPLTVDSIPDTIQMIFASDNLKYSLDGVTPNGVKIIKSTSNKKYKFGVPLKTDYFYW
ncbi:hypothetical protein ACTFIY_003136 [Dictyostelium cf. discoideum]